MRKAWQFGLIAVLGLLVIATTVLWIDPFNWHLIERLTGQYDATLVAVPADSYLYVGVDLLAADTEQLATLRDMFIRATSETSLALEGQQDLEAMLADTLNLSVEDDLMPWVGQYVGVAVVDTGGWLVVAEARNQQLADAFLHKLTLGWADWRGKRATRQMVEGVEITLFASDLAYGRSGRLLLFGSDETIIHRAILAQNGRSLGDTSAYQTTIAALGERGLVTAYVNGPRAYEWVQANEGQWSITARTAVNSTPIAALQGVGATIDVVANGIQVDSVVHYDASTLPSTQERGLASWTQETETAVLLPEETFLYVTGPRLERTWATVREALIDDIGLADFEESMMLFAEQFGLNPDDDLLTHLDGAMGVAVRPSSTELQPTLAQVGLGITAVVETSQAGTLADNMASFATQFGAGIGSVTQVIEGEQTLNQVESVLFPNWYVSYTLDKSHMWFGSSLAMVSHPFDDSLVTDEGYQLATETLGTAPSFYVDVKALGLWLLTREELVSNETHIADGIAILQPVSLIAGTHHVSEGNLHYTILIFVERL